MIEIKSDKIKLYKFKILSNFNDIIHFTTTRQNGSSKSPYESLNLGMHVEDDRDAVKHNRFRTAAETSIPPQWFTFADQVHGNKVSTIKSNMRGSGANDYKSSIGHTDAMITDSEDICLMILTADCVPITLYDPVKRAAGVIHAGWKSTALRIASRTVEKMIDEFGCDPTNIIAGLGPSIGLCCYSIGDETADKIETSIGSDWIKTNDITGLKHMDLWEANKFQLISSGISVDNIEVSGICTSCVSDDFYSYRRDGKTGRFGTGIMIRNEICASCTAMHCNWCNKE